MKIFLSFSLLYLIFVSSIFSFYTDILVGYSNKLSSTQSKLVGVEYLNMLHKLSADTIKCMNYKHKKEQQDTIKIDIKKIYTFLEKHPKFNNKVLHKHLEFLLKFHSEYNNFDYYNFFDYINQENYLVGNKAEILFSQNKEQYFLGTLMTHYIPEFYISLGISHSILQKFIKNKTIENSEKNIYLEQSKLVYLSSQELEGIIDLLLACNNAISLEKITTRIATLLNTLKNKKDNLTHLDNYSDKSELHLEIISKVFQLAEKLTTQNSLLLTNLLKHDEETFKDKIIFYRSLLIFILIFISLIFFYFFRTFNSNVKKDKELVSLNESLIQRVEKEVAINRRKDQQILQQSRLAQMGEMISMIAHQWRQPLAAISSTSIGLELKARLNKIDNETILKATHNISEYSQHLSSTIDDFREFFQSNKEKKDTNFSNLIESVLKIIEVSIKNKNIEIITDLKSDDNFYTYPNEIKQVILNLMKNAEDVLIEREIKNPKITIETKNTVLLISDNGGGIADDIIKNIFNPYFSTKLEKNGTGLGLYMSNTIIQDHCGGELSVSNGEHGAIFKIDFSNITNTNPH